MKVTTQTVSPGGADTVMTLAEAAQLLNLSPETLRWQIRNGKLRARKIGPLWTVTEREVERYRADNLRSTSGS